MKMNLVTVASEAPHLVGGTGTPSRGRQRRGTQSDVKKEGDVVMDKAASACDRRID